MNRPTSSDKPWFAPEQKKSGMFRTSKIAARSEAAAGQLTQFVGLLRFFSYAIMGTLAFVLAGAALAFASRGAAFLLPYFIWITAAIAFGLVGFVFVAKQCGRVVARISPMHSNESFFALAFRAARGEVSVEENKVKPLPAPELALQQFILQVRAYATEKAYQRTKPSERANQPGNITHNETADLLKRRWEEVLDSLNEFEIYLANDPQGVVEKLASKYPTQLMDVSKIFREVGDGFDNTWRRKGINIETAIVTPLKATTNEAILRRLLVGPWRASAYFAKRGNGVVFSAKSMQGKVIAHWESEGINIPESYLEFAQDSSKPLNERIERGLQVIGNDSSSPNVLNALISLVAWIDLARASDVDYVFKNTNDGFVIEMNLK